MTWSKERKKLLEEISKALMLEDDFLLSEIKTAETKAEAISRMESVIQDAETALDILTK